MLPHRTAPAGLIASRITLKPNAPQEGSCYRKGSTSNSVGAISPSPTAPEGNMQTITPKSWDSFQHYKDRSPSWIKLHRRILDDYDFHCLPDASKALAPCLWLLASEYDAGSIPLDIERIAFRMRMTQEKLRESLKPLIEKGFFTLDGDASRSEQIASEVLADCLPRGEKRREEKEKKAPAIASFSVQNLIDDGLTEELASEYIAFRKKIKKPLTDRAWGGVKREAEKAGWPLQSVVEMCLEKSWRGFDAEWVAKLPVPGVENSSPRSDGENWSPGVGKWL